MVEAHQESSGRAMTLVWAAVISAFVSAITTTGLQHWLDIQFPVPRIVEVKQPTGLQIPVRSYSFSFDSYKDAAEPGLFGLIQHLPTYYYELTLGNTSDEDSGIVSVTIDFPEEFHSAAVFLPTGNKDSRSGRCIKFQLDELKANQGKTITLGVMSEELPDITKVVVHATCQAGDFAATSKSIYGKVFK